MTLNDLMAKYGSDKAAHGFCEFYESFFAPVRESVRAFLEIGVYYGASMRAWLDYFENAKVYGIDDARWQRGWNFGTDRAEVALADQGSRIDLAAVLETVCSVFDIVLDDGSHKMWDQQVSLARLLPAVRPGGYYVVEDLQSSFHPVASYSAEGKTLLRYATGSDFPLTTTHEVLSNWPDVKSDYVTQDEWDYCVAHIGSVEIFDRDGDHKHMTSIVEVK